VDFPLTDLIPQRATTTHTDAQYKSCHRLWRAVLAPSPARSNPFNFRAYKKMASAPAQHGLKGSKVHHKNCANPCAIVRYCALFIDHVLITSLLHVHSINSWIYFQKVEQNGFYKNQNRQSFLL
jgi:hypothetical protein